MVESLVAGIVDAAVARIKWEEEKVEDVKTASELHGNEADEQCNNEITSQSDPEPGGGQIKTKKRRNNPFSSSGYVRKRKKKRGTVVGPKPVVPALTNQPVYVEDEFEPLDSEDDMGKGKRKRYQNVRMLPIHERVSGALPSSPDIKDLRRKVMSIRRRKKPEISIDQEIELIKRKETSK